MKSIPITVALALATSGDERLSAARGRDRFTATDKLREGRFGTGTAGRLQSRRRHRFLSLFVPANLQGANLTEASLQGAHLRKAKLQGADLTGATGLTQEQLASAVCDQATGLPAGLVLDSAARHEGGQDALDNRRQGEHR
jgi:hypothetical protein